MHSSIVVMATALSNGLQALDKAFTLSVNHHHPGWQRITRLRSSEQGNLSSSTGQAAPASDYEHVTTQLAMVRCIN